jgi:cysteine sulfinate desulfinase/cysteine desulfurase-like protein
LRNQPYYKKTQQAMHTDAAQSVGKVPTDVEQLGVDLLSAADTGNKLKAL